MSEAIKDVEFAVEGSDGAERIFDTFDQAAGYAVARAASNGEPVDLDVIVWSAKGAYDFGGDDALASYREDPDASVFERITIKAESKGRIA